MKGFSGFKQSSPTKLAGGRYLWTENPEGGLKKTQISASEEARLLDEARKAAEAGDKNYIDPHLDRTGIEQYKEGGKYAGLGLDSMDKIHAKYAELMEKYKGDDYVLGGGHVPHKVTEEPDYKLMKQLKSQIDYAQTAAGKAETRKQEALDQ